MLEIFDLLNDINENDNSDIFVKIYENYKSN